MSGEGTHGPELRSLPPAPAPSTVNTTPPGSVGTQHRNGQGPATLGDQRGCSSVGSSVCFDDHGLYAPAAPVLPPAAPPRVAGQRSRPATLPADVADRVRADLTFEGGWRGERSRRYRAGRRFKSEDALPGEATFDDDDDDPAAYDPETW